MQNVIALYEDGYLTKAHDSLDKLDYKHAQDPVYKRVEHEYTNLMHFFYINNAANFMPKTMPLFLSIMHDHACCDVMESSDGTLKCTSVVRASAPVVSKVLSSFEWVDESAHISREVLARPSKTQLHVRLSVTPKLLFFLPSREFETTSKIYHTKFNTCVLVEKIPVTPDCNAVGYDCSDEASFCCILTDTDKQSCRFTCIIKHEKYQRSSLAVKYCYYAPIILHVMQCIHRQATKNRSANAKCYV